MAQAETVIYEPPHSGLPYLVVTITPNGVTAIQIQHRGAGHDFTTQRAAAYKRPAEAQPCDVRGGSDLEIGGRL